MFCFFASLFNSRAATVLLWTNLASFFVFFKIVFIPGVFSKVSFTHNSNVWMSQRCWDRCPDICIPSLTLAALSLTEGVWGKDTQIKRTYLQFWNILSSWQTKKYFWCNSCREQWVRVFVDGFSAERITQWAYFHSPIWQWLMWPWSEKMASGYWPTGWSSRQKIHQQTPSPIDLSKSYMKFSFGLTWW